MEMLNFLNSEDLAGLSVMKESFNKSVKEVMSIVANKGDIAPAVSKLCSLIQSTHEMMHSLFELSQQNLLNLLAVQKDIELRNIRRDAVIKTNSSKIESTETKMACTSDMNRVCITFACDKELDELKRSKNLISDAKLILNQMKIDVDKLGILPIRSAYFQHIKMGTSVIPSLYIIFNNAQIASAVRKRIGIFNAQLRDNNKLHEIKYTVRLYWSKDVWKLLKICKELRRLKLINSAFVSSDGIRVKYNNPAYKEKMEVKIASMNVTCFEDIDKIRKEVGDIYSEASCKILYDNSYFSLKFSERDSRRSSHDNMFDSDDDFSDDQFNSIK
ncbi:hypothetical protein ACKWTF_013389 [Chironomus riparius]